MAEAAPLVLGHLESLREARALGPIVDLACGRGRNALALLGHGIDCVGLDRSRAFLGELSP